MGALTIAEAVTLINKEKGVVIDLRSEEEFTSGTIAGAKSVPLGHLAERLTNTVKNKELPLILICATGARSQRAVGQVKRLGYGRVQSMAGGMAAWRGANMPIHKA